VAGPGVSRRPDVSPHGTRVPGLVRANGEVPFARDPEELIAFGPATAEPVRDRRL